MGTHLKDDDLRVQEVADLSVVAIGKTSSSCSPRKSQSSTKLWFYRDAMKPQAKCVAITSVMRYPQLQQLLKITPASQSQDPARSQRETTHQPPGTFQHTRAKCLWGCNTRLGTDLTFNSRYNWGSGALKHRREEASRGGTDEERAKICCCIL